MVQALRAVLVLSGKYILENCCTGVTGRWFLGLFFKSNLRINSIKSDLMIPYQKQFQTKEYLYEHMPPIEHRKRP